jgi:hypothetical protein
VWLLTNVSLGGFILMKLVLGPAIWAHKQSWAVASG